MRYQFIEAHRQRYPISVMCQMLAVSVSGYYAWRQRPPSGRTKANQLLVQQIKAIHKASYRTYGSPRIHAELVAQGLRCGHNRVARLMRQYGIVAKQHHHRRTTTARNLTDPVAPNLLDRQFEAKAPNRKWVADISYIPTQEGDLYLATVMDLPKVSQNHRLGNGRSPKNRVTSSCLDHGPQSTPTATRPAASF